MDAIQLVRKQATQDAQINAVTNEVTTARTSKNGTVHQNIKARLDAIETNADTIKNSITTAINGLSWKPTVATVADLATQYPNAQDGWCANVTADGCLYRYTKANAGATGQWIKISANAIPKASASVDGLMSKEHFSKLQGMPVANTIITTAGGQTINGTLKATTFIGALQGNATTASKVNNVLTIEVGGTNTVYDGSSAKTVSVAPATHNHTGTQVTLTGYNKGANAGAVTATDTVNTAIAKLENQIANKTAKVTKSVSYVNHVVANTGKTLSQVLNGYASGDIVEVYISGVLLRPNYHYKISFAGTTATLTCDNTTTGNTDGWYAGEDITFKILKIS